MSRYRCWAYVRLELGAIEALNEDDAIELADTSPWNWPSGDYKVLQINAEEDD
jgi:hypothetical protein